MAHVELKFDVPTMCGLAWFQSNAVSGELLPSGSGVCGPPKKAAHQNNVCLTSQHIYYTFILDYIYVGVFIDINDYHGCFYN